MTITFKPKVQLDFSTLLAAGSRSKHAPVAMEHQLFLLAPVLQATSESSMGSTSALLGMPSQQQLMVFDGRHLLLCSLYPGIDPSQRRIYQSLNARALLLYGRGSSFSTNSNQTQEATETDDNGRLLLTKQPDPGVPGQLPGMTAVSTPAPGAAVQQGNHKHMQFLLPC